MIVELRILSAVLVLVGVLAVAGCTGTASRPSRPQPVGTVGTLAVTRTECVAVVDAARTLAAGLGRFFAGKITADELRTGFEELSDAVDTAEAVVTGTRRAQLADAAAALDRAWDIRAVDVPTLRANAADVLAALSDALDACAPAAGAVHPR